jgi:sugar-specific transcriptional regulator TrmB
MNTIISYLEQLDLSEIEAKLYLQLLKTGAISVRELARATGINRSTTYLYINQLIEKELIVKLVKGSRTQIAAVQPNTMLPYLVEKRAATAKTLQEQLPSILQNIASSFPKVEDAGEAEIKYYKGRLGVKKIYEDVLKTKELRSYVDVLKISEIFPENFQLFNDAFKHNPDIKMFEICGNSPKAKEYIQGFNENKRHRYKILPNDMELTGQDVLIYDNKIAIINLKDTISGIILHNNDLFNNFKLLFDFLWKILPE